MNEPKDHANINKFVHPPVVMFIFIAIAYIAKWSIPIPYELPNILRYIGFVLVILALILGFAAALKFREAQTTILPHGSVSNIINTGVYCYTRNPIYLGFLLILIGFPLFTGTLWGLLLTPVFVFTMNNLIIQHEEAYLEKKFGEQYTSYKSSVRRWL